MKKKSIVRKEFKELFALFVGGILVLCLTVGMLFMVVALDGSKNKCASKIAVKIYDRNCF